LKTVAPFFGVKPFKMMVSRLWLATVDDVKTRIIGSNSEIFIPKLV